MLRRRGDVVNDEEIPLVGSQIDIVNVEEGRQVFTRHVERRDDFVDVCRAGQVHLKHTQTTRIRLELDSAAMQEMLGGLGVV